VAGVDLGKQVGPLPLGAWVAVVAGGLGIAVYTRRQSAAPAEIVDNTSGDAGVGTGAVGGFIPTSPNPTAPIATPTTNDEWAVMVENGLIAKNYPAAQVDSMVRKYISGASSTMSPQEYALLGVALATYGAPPQTLPPDGTPPGTTPPTGGGTTPPPVTKPGLKYMVQVHQISRAEAARSLIQRFSSRSASGNQIQVALLRTTADPRNAKYMPYYTSHRGVFPAQAKIYTTVVV
jgi:hypothetical protein